MEGLHEATANNAEAAEKGKASGRLEELLRQLKTLLYGTRVRIGQLGNLLVEAIS